MAIRMPQSLSMIASSLVSFSFVNLHTFYICWKNQNRLIRFRFSLIRVRFSDVDDTVYPLSSGISTECTKNIRGKASRANRCIDSIFLELSFVNVYVFV